MPRCSTTKKNGTIDVYSVLNSKRSFAPELAGYGFLESVWLPACETREKPYGAIVDAALEVNNQRLTGTCSALCRDGACSLIDQKYSLQTKMPASRQTRSTNNIRPIV